MSESISETKREKEKAFATPGEILSKARAARNVSIDAVAMELLVSKDRIVELESDDYSKIAAPVYARGYLRSYVHFLQIPEEEVLESFSNMGWYRENKKEDFVLLHPLSEAKETKNKHNATKLVYLFAIVLVIVFAVVFYTHSNAGAIDNADKSTSNGNSSDPSNGNNNNQMIEQKISVTGVKDGDASKPQAQVSASQDDKVQADDKNNSNNSTDASMQTSGGDLPQVPLLQKVERVPASANNNADNKVASDNADSASSALSDNTHDKSKAAKNSNSPDKHISNSSKKKSAAANEEESSAAADDEPDQD